MLKRRGKGFEEGDLDAAKKSQRHIELMVSHLGCVVD